MAAASALQLHKNNDSPIFIIFLLLLIVIIIIIIYTHAKDAPVFGKLICLSLSIDWACQPSCLLSLFTSSRSFERVVRDTESKSAQYYYEWTLAINIHIGFLVCSKKKKKKDFSGTPVIFSLLGRRQF